MVSKSWTLADWYSASGVRFAKKVMDMAIKKGFISVPYGASTITDWKKGRIDNEEGIKRREDAIVIIKALRACAEEKNYPLFTDENIILQSTVFLKSGACAQKFAPLEMDELMEICGQDANISVAHFYNAPQLADLSQHITPAPPLYLFGRDDDIKTVNQSFTSNPICVIDGVGGDGKTALAWHSAIKAIADDQFKKLAWVTDKRYFIDAMGNVQTVVDEVDHDDFMEKICQQMVRAFQWIRLKGTLGDRLINACVDQLRKEKYLLVVDNFETVESNDEIIRRLLSMFTTSLSDNPIASRVLITTREQFIHPNCTRITLSGIGEKGSRKYIQHLQSTWAVKNKLKASQIDALAKTAVGNPLLLQIAMQRYSIAPSKRTFDDIIASLAEGNMGVLEKIFKPTLDRLPPDVRDYAIRLSKEYTYSQSDITQTHLQAIWQDVHHDTDRPYSSALQLLVRHRILNWSGSNRYSMHAIIRSYLLFLSQNHDSDTSLS